MSDQARIDQLVNAPNRHFDYNNFHTLYAEDIKYAASAGGGGGGARFHAFRNAALNVSSLTVIGWDMVIEDTANAYDDVLDAYFAPQDGVYIIELAVELGGLGLIQFNGNLVQGGIGFNPGTAVIADDQQFYRQSWTRYLSEGFFIDMRAQADTTANIGGFRSQLRIYQIA